MRDYAAEIRELTPNLVDTTAMSLSERRDLFANHLRIDCLRGAHEGVLVMLTRVGDKVADFNLTAAVKAGGIYTAYLYFSDGTTAKAAQSFLRGHQ